MSPKINPDILKRTPKPDEEEIEADPASVSAGPVDKVIELAFNPSREKLREVTIIDRMQGRLLPQLDLIAVSWQYAIEISVYRQDSIEYEKIYRRKRPVATDLIDEFMYRTAQWQKSVQGKNLDRAIDIALAETETRPDDDEYSDKTDPFEK